MSDFKSLKVLGVSRVLEGSSFEAVNMLTVDSLVLSCGSSYCNQRIRSYHRTSFERLHQKLTALLQAESNFHFLWKLAQNYADLHLFMSANA